jgi:lipocalin
MLFIFIFSLFSIVSSINVVNELNINNYLGHWFQIYGAPTNVIFQGNGTCITADYQLLDNGFVSVLNSQINDDGNADIISGYAYYKNVSEPGKLTVHLDGVPVDSPYWVVKLGEIVDDEYQYSIVTTPSGISLWVLARDVRQFFNEYNDEVKDFLDQYNYRYVEIEQDICYKYFNQ